VRLHLLVDTTEKAFDVTSAGPSNPQAFTLTVDLAAGLHSLQAFSEFLPNVSNTSSAFSRTLYVGEIALSAAGGQASPAVAAKLLGCGAAAPASEACTTQVLSSWLPRAWRRPVTPAEVASLAQIVTSSVSSPTETGSLQQKWDSGIGLALAASLTSPNFIYRPEFDPDPASTTPHPVGDYELASRLSYFLWSSMPDDALFAKAAAGTLHAQVVLDAEVERMLADPKASALAENFAGQWLQLRKLAAAQPDPKIFPTFNRNVRASMVQETTRLFSDFLQPGRALPDIIDANYTFIDRTLATHYGMPQPSADFAQTSLGGTHRAGLLSQGGILTLTSMANRTSPVLRGKFVLSRLLCSMPPPPPPNVPPFNENTSEGSVRQRLEGHIKSGAACASCHTSLDPIGLSMENFDGVGVYRTADGPYPVDTTGLTYSGADIHDIASLAAAVKVNPAFIPCVSSQLYSYAMGQQATSGDAAVIASLGAQVAPNRYRLRDMIHAVTRSAPFVTRAGGL
jgi:hypothetical protein